MWARWTYFCRAVCGMCRVYNSDNSLVGGAWSKLKDVLVDRAERMYKRDRNHAFVIMWSMGNESNYGENFNAMSSYIRENEGAFGGASRHLFILKIRITDAPPERCLTVSM